MNKVKVDAGRIKIKYLDCGGRTGLLPYVLLRWSQKKLRKGWRWGLENDPDGEVMGVYYTEADNVLDRCVGVGHAPRPTHDAPP